jgi:hypothetical protein
VPLEKREDVRHSDSDHISVIAARNLEVLVRHIQFFQLGSCRASADPPDSSAKESAIPLTEFFETRSSLLFPSAFRHSARAFRHCDALE